MELDLPTRALYELAYRIHHVRNAAGMSQEDFSKQIHLDRSYISRVERGEQNISFKNLCKIAHGLGKDLAYFTTDLPAPSRKNARYPRSRW